MGTSAYILQVDRNDHTRASGVRVNYDGYQSNVGPFLSIVLNRLGSVERLMAVLEDGVEWSSLDAGQGVSDGNRYITFEGIGRAFPDDDAFPLPAGDIAELVLGEEWAYLFSADGRTLGVYHSGNLVGLHSVYELDAVRWS